MGLAARKPRRLPERRSATTKYYLLSPANSQGNLLVERRAGKHTVTTRITDRRVLNPQAKRTLKARGVVIGRAADLYSGVKRGAAKKRGKK